MTTRIVFEFSQIPNAKDLELLIALAAKFNATAFEFPGQPKTEPDSNRNGQQQPAPSYTVASNLSDVAEIAEPTPFLQLNFKKFPQDITPFAIKTAQLDSISALFNDEPSAEILCEMLAA